MLSLLPPKFRALTGVLFVTALALILAGCKAAQVDPSVIDAADPAASEFGKALQTAAGEAVGPIGWAAAGFFLPVIYAFLKSSLKGVGSAAGTAATSVVKTVTGGTPPTGAP